MYNCNRKGVMHDIADIRGFNTMSNCCFNV